MRRRRCRAALVHHRSENAGCLDDAPVAGALAPPPGRAGPGPPSQRPVLGLPFARSGSRWTAMRLPSSGRRCGTMRAHGRRILSLRRGHDLGGRRSTRAHVLQLLDLPPDRRAVVVLLADPGPGRRPDGGLPVGRQVARSPSLRDLRLHHALVADRSGARSHGRQRAPDGAHDRRGGAGPTVRRRRYVDVPRVALSPQWSPRRRSLDRERRRSRNELAAARQGHPAPPRSRTLAELTTARSK
jgi:hypothetical protein